MQNIKFICKSKKILGDDIALHWLLPKQELPRNIKRIPVGQVWIRDDIYDDLWKFILTKTHELKEIELMQKGYDYPAAHQIAEMADWIW